MGNKKEHEEEAKTKSSKSSSPKKKKSTSGSKINKWINAQLEAKGLSASAAKKNAGKYKRISAAKKAGSLYYTNPKGTVMIAAFASDLDSVPKKKKKPIDSKEVGKQRDDMRRSAKEATKKSKEVAKDVMSDEQKKSGQITKTTVVQASGKLKPSAKGMGQFESPFQGPLGKKIADFFERRNEGLKKDAEKRKSSDIKEVNEFKKAKEAAEKKSRDYYNNLSKTAAFKNLPKKTQNMIKNLATGKIPMADSARDKQIKSLMKNGMNVGGLTSSPMMNGLSRKINPTTGLTMNKGGMTDYRKKGMFYGGGMARRGR